ncbi:hypothetical protein ACXR2U_05875 [Jatrophihabitans sp. YIM 134969]
MNDLIPPSVHVADVHAALAVRGVPVGDRDVPVGPTVRALVVPTSAGTLVTLERRGTWTSPRPVVLGRLSRLSAEIAHDLRAKAGTPDEPGQNRAVGRHLTG